MPTWKDKVHILSEALPFIRQFKDRIVVVKCGGATLIDAQMMQQIMQDIVLLYSLGVYPVIVHGGGPEINELCQRLQIPIHFKDGLRVTNAETMEIVQMSLFGKTNRTLVSTLNRMGVKAVGLTGQDARILECKQHITTDLGFVGEISHCDTKLIKSLLAEGYLPVISPIGVDTSGLAYNINADIVAGCIAGHLNAEKLYLLTDVNGVYQVVDEPKTRIEQITATEINIWLEQKRISDGMIPKLKACLLALSLGVKSAHILDGAIPHSLLVDVFPCDKMGTLICAD